MDLYEPSSGSHVHDLNGGILQSGLFWTLPVDDDALHISDDGREAVLELENLQVTDTFQLLSGIGTPASISLHAEWRATGPPVKRGQGRAVAPTDPGAFLGRFAAAESRAAFRVAEFGFSFRSDPGVSTARTFAEIGHERNGVFL